MQLYDREKLRVDNYTAYMDSVIEARDIEMAIDRLIDKRGVSVTSIQLASLYNIGVIGVATLLPNTIKIPLLLSSLAYTSYKFFICIKKIESIDKKVASYRKELFNINETLRSGGIL